MQRSHVFSYAQDSPPSIPLYVRHPLRSCSGLPAKAARTHSDVSQREQALLYTDMCDEARAKGQGAPHPTRDSILLTTPSYSAPQLRIPLATRAALLRLPVWVTPAGARGELDAYSLAPKLASHVVVRHTGFNPGEMSH